MDMLHKLFKTADHYRYTVAALIVVGVILGMSGCALTTQSVVEPDKQVTEQELVIEVATTEAEFAKRKIELDAMVAQYNTDVEAFNSKVTLASTDIQEQKKMRAKLYEIAGAAVTQWASGGVPTEALVGTGLTLGSVLLGIGATADNRRKDAVIKSNSAPSATSA